MAKNDPVWSYGKSKLFTSSGATVGDGDDDWSYGKSVLFHEYVAPSGGVIMPIFSKGGIHNKICT